MFIGFLLFINIIILIIRYWLVIILWTIKPRVEGRRAWTWSAMVALSVGCTRAPGHMVWPTNWIPSGGPRDSSRSPLSRARPVANRTSFRLLEGKIKNKKLKKVIRYRRRREKYERPAGRFSKAKTWRNLSSADQSFIFVIWLFRKIKK